MRRPGPLPPSSRAEAPSAADEERQLAERRAAMERLGIERAPAEAPIAPDRAAPDPAAPERPASEGRAADDHTDTAPIVALRPAEPRADAALVASETADGGADDPDEASGEPVGWAGVWRAARARRRVLRAEVRRFTARARRRRLGWTIALGSVLVLVVGSVGAAYSPLFAVEEISVEGTELLDADAVASALGDQMGKPLPLVDDSAVKAALVGFPLVQSYAIEAHPPHDLVVRIVERTPVGVLQSDAGFTTVDAAGVALTTAGERPGGLPLIEVDGGTTSEAFLAVGEVLRALPDELRSSVTSATATTAEDVSLLLGEDGPQVIWGSADRSPYKALVLQKALGGALAADATVYDVSAPDTIIVR
ncbi:FtsQ-type POTRA domain-containing protein [Microbacterium oryzae]|uniref:FtsQ-type POTRA domain-containing protein n=1 Tax=Microbacterium oryzae TaxID=743009 RepID=UPI0025AF2901|nr:FtsQ-type POTRA domain-containing protein [Microbacterium oryzae]MDN3311895.1 FtsQ-type POTRA domain-containing protein [Microbacterium oryzae]